MKTLSVKSLNKVTAGDGIYLYVAAHGVVRQDRAVSTGQGQPFTKGTDEGATPAIAFTKAQTEVSISEG